MKWRKTMLHVKFYPETSTTNVGVSNFDNQLGAPNFDTLYLKRSSGLECRCIVKVKCIREAE